MRSTVCTRSRGTVQDLTQGRVLLATTGRLWPQMRELCTLINEGSPPLKVEMFNGGLFDAQHYPFLEQYSVGDAHLQHAIDMLAPINGQFIDYHYLAERHLGTIYEGLLEHHLQPIAPEHEWTIDLFNDQGERKTTGSYYTPDFIVRSMVDRTLGPLLSAGVDGQPDDAAKIGRC